jgi:hypothetical protein
MDFFCVHVNPAVTFGLILGSEIFFLSYDTNAGLPPTNSTKLGIEETRNMNERRGGEPHHRDFQALAAIVVQPHR